MPTQEQQNIWLQLAQGRIVFAVEATPGDAGPIIDAGSWGQVLARLRHEPALAAELEAAIADIEDGLMPALRELPHHRRLASELPVLRRIVQVVGHGGAELDRGDVEYLFNQLADIASGSPVRLYPLPTDREFVAAVLVLREVMHHGAFATIAMGVVPAD